MFKILKTIAVNKTVIYEDNYSLITVG